MVTLKKDGAEIKTYESRDDLFIGWSKSRHPYTLSWGVKHEGYTVEEDGKDISSEMF